MVAAVASLDSFDVVDAASGEEARRMGGVDSLEWPPDNWRI